MSQFKVNLIKDTLAPPAYRRTFYWIVVAYLFLSGVSLFFICFRATTKCVYLWEQRHNVELAERALLADTGLDGIHPQRVADLCANLAYTATVLEKINGIMEQRLFLVPVLLGVARPLTAETHLARFDVNRKNGLLQFDVIIPAEHTKNVLQADGLLDAWNHDPYLRQQINDLRLSANQHKVIDNRGFFILKFEGTLRHKG